eukprot:266327_1
MQSIRINIERLINHCNCLLIDSLKDYRQYIISNSNKQKLKEYYKRICRQESNKYEWKLRINKTKKHKPILIDSIHSEPFIDYITNIDGNLPQIPLPSTHYFEIKA